MCHGRRGTAHPVAGAQGGATRGVRRCHVRGTGRSQGSATRDEPHRHICPMLCDAVPCCVPHAVCPMQCHSVCPTLCESVCLMLCAPCCVPHAVRVCVPHAVCSHAFPPLLPAASGGSQLPGAPTPTPGATRSPAPECTLGVGVAIISCLRLCPRASQCLHALLVRRRKICMRYAPLNVLPSP